MHIPTIERCKLTHLELAMNLSNTTSERITQIIANTRTSKGHEASEAKAKEIRELLESGISEKDLLKKLKAM